MEKSALVSAALQALIQREAARRLARLGGIATRSETCAPTPIEGGVILVDSSVWVDHLHRADEMLTRSARSGQVMTHPFVIGELAIGNLATAQRGVCTFCGSCSGSSWLAMTRSCASSSNERLFGVGLGYVDVHLLAAARLTPETTLWTRDKRLSAAAERLSLAARLTH